MQQFSCRRLVFQSASSLGKDLLLDSSMQLCFSNKANRRLENDLLLICSKHSKQSLSCLLVQMSEDNSASVLEKEEIGLGLF